MCYIFLAIMQIFDFFKNSNPVGENQGFPLPGGGGGLNRISECVYALSRGIPTPLENRHHENEAILTQS